MALIYCSLAAYAACVVLLALVELLSLDAGGIEARDAARDAARRQPRVLWSRWTVLPFQEGLTLGTLAEDRPVLYWYSQRQRFAPGVLPPAPGPAVTRGRREAICDAERSQARKLLVQELLSEWPEFSKLYGRTA